MRNERRVILAIAAICGIALSGCRGAPGNNASDSAGAGSSSAAAQTGTLTGLYEGRAQSGTSRRDQMCMIERDGRATFGIVTWGERDTNCSGSGMAVREGDRLRLTMEGDESCTIDARIEGTRVVMPSNVPAGCAYYCGPGARMTGAQFDKTGGIEADAGRAVDLVGDPLCGR